MAFKKNQIGPNNDYWKGDSVGYHGLHGYLRKHYPKPNKCQKCDKPSKWIDLANITGVYKRDIKNFAYLCRSCHNTIDGKVNYLGIYAKIKGKCHLANLGKKKAHGKYKYPGISKVKKSNKFQCNIMYRRKSHYLGAFNTQLGAYRAYKKKLREFLANEGMSTLQ